MCEATHHCVEATGVTKGVKVCLELGEELYEAQGAIVSQCHQAAAAVALQETHYSHPPSPSAIPKGTQKSHFYMYVYKKLLK